jgi:UDP-glucose 4-epimerase
MKVLVVGGAGYVGSQVMKSLARRGYEPVVLDNLSSGHADSVRYGRLIVGDAADAELLRSVFSSERFIAVMHFASHIQVGESMLNPSRYYGNNVCATLTLLDAMRAAAVNRCIFSSSAAVYGAPATMPVSEDHPAAPINPYGRSKWIVEQILLDYSAAYGLQHACLRYFNAAGADPECELGERHVPETHLIPLVLQAASGGLKDVAVFGRDYPTRDGTCERDYVHVHDLAHAHVLALEHLVRGAANGTFNLGAGRGYTVQEVIALAGEVTGRPIGVRHESKRIGDPPCLIADSRKAFRVLGWTPSHSDMKTILQHAWRWEQRISPDK